MTRKTGGFNHPDIRGRPEKGLWDVKLKIWNKLI